MAKSNKNRALMEWLVNPRIWQQPNYFLDPDKPYRFHQSLDVYEPAPLVGWKHPPIPGFGGCLMVKDESGRFGLQAFKGLGASYAVQRYIETYGKPQAFCTATDGNHGRAVAWAAEREEVPAYIFMPAGTAKGRVKAIEALGAEVEVTAWDYDQTVAYAQSKADHNNFALIQDTAWYGYETIPRWIMEGYLTQMLEVNSQLKDLKTGFPDIVFLQCGVGSWAASVIWYIREYLKRSPQIVLVEPVNAAGSLASAKVGYRVAPKGSFQTTMAGLNCGIPSLLAWPVLQQGVDLFVAIEDEWVHRAIPLYREAGISTTATGAATLGALLATCKQPECSNALGLSDNSSVLLFNTEGNTHT